MSDLTPREQLAQIIDRGMFPETPDDVRSTEDAIADAVISAGWRPPARVVTTVGELDALPRGTVIRDALSVQECLGEWLSPHAPLWAGTAGDMHTSGNLHLPATVLWEPEEGE